ncbi:MAG: NAD-dependent epimerase/dehydratase family protein [Bacteroidetes bacterium]|nr:NAD-dependent epimerase/dehydratase family protein [Bacteroidota bacterium]
MNSIKRSALIAGSSGLIGAELLQLLLNDGVYSKVYSLVRKNTGIRHPKLEEILVNFDALDASLGSIKADDVFCCLGTTMKKAGSEAAFRKVDYDYPLALAHWAKVSAQVDSIWFLLWGFG